MRKEIEFKNQRVSYFVSGKGLPVVLVHGFGEDHRIWDNLKSLEEDHTLILPDLPGSGSSPFNAEVKSIEELADSVHEIIQKETTGKIILIGHSMGGYITMAYAKKYASHLKGFGLFHSIASADSPEKIATRKKGIDFIRQHGGKAFLETAIGNLFSPVTKERSPGLISSSINSFSDMDGAALVSYYEAMIARPDLTSVLGDTTVPVLFIIGEHDAAVSPEESLKQSHLPTLSVVHILEECGHLGMLEKPAESLQIVRQYIDYVEQKA